VTETEGKLKTETDNFNSKLNGLSIDQFIMSNLPEKLPNGLSREDAAILFKSKNKVEKTETGFIIIDPATGQPKKDKKLNPISADSELKAFAESFGKVNNDGRGSGDDKSKHKTNIEALTKRSEVEAYFEKNETPLSEQSGILAKAMKNEGFKINE
jgi:hypothetical protein